MSGLISTKEYRIIEQALAGGDVPPSYTALGGGVGIHGGGVRRFNGEKSVLDWTEGCVALDDQAMDVLYGFCEKGTRVIILNSRRDVFALMRPFAQPVGSDEGFHAVASGDRIPLSQVHLDLGFGRAVLRLRQGCDHRRSLEVQVYHGYNHAPPHAVVSDRNGDGKFGFGDTVTGVQDQEGRAFYESLLQQMRTSLSEGRVVCP